MNKNAKPFLLLIALALFATGAGASAAGPAAVAAPAPQARVAGGVRVPMVSSARTAQQWSAQRPGFRNLRPKARSNVE